MALANLLTEKLLKAVEREDEKTLIFLDENGFIAGEKDDGKAFAETLRELLQQTKEFEKDLKKGGRQIDELLCDKEKLIPAKVFQENESETQRLFQFKINWVPGFFITPRFGFLFAGCAYSFEKGIFSIFIVSKKFRQQEKWFLYNRTELISHELCHVARASLMAHKYEEYFAYHTSPTKFRRIFGSMVRSSFETFLLLGLCFALIPIQALETLGYFGMTSLWTSPFTYAISASLGYLGFLIARQLLMIKSLDKLKEKLKALSPSPQALLFRCSDKEIDQLLSSKENSRKTILERIQSPVRKIVIANKFLSK